MRNIRKAFILGFPMLPMAGPKLTAGICVVGTKTQTVENNKLTDTEHKRLTEYIASKIDKK
jgi:hypothetical protein